MKKSSISEKDQKLIQREEQIMINLTTNIY